MRTVLTADRLWTGSRFLNDPVLTIEDGRIASLFARDAGELPAGRDERILEFPGATLAPAFLDVHFHGAAGHDIMEATPEALKVIGRFLASRGTARYLATTVTAPMDATLRALSGLAKQLGRKPDAAEAEAVGIHLEGPFISHAKRGVHPPEFLQPPSTGVFDRLFEAAEGHIRLVTLAPELPGAAELAAHATARSVRVSLGHSDATAAETRAAIDAGAVSATHTFNAMRALDHREPGILGTVLADDALFAELICDGIHNAPEIVRIWWRCKGPDRAILITDGMSATGMPDGEYRLGGFTVHVANGRATMGDVLAGSVLTQDRALENFLRFTGARLEDGLRLLTTNPSTMAGLSDMELVEGQPANLVAVDRAGRLIASFVDGHRG